MRTRTADLYRVKGQSLCTSNNLEGVGDYLSTWNAAKPGFSQVKLQVKKFADLMRHSNSATTIELYTQSPMAQRIAAQESVLRAILAPPARVRIRGCGEERGMA